MNIKEIKEKSNHQLQNLIKESKEKLKELRFDVANRSIKDSSDIKKTRKIIARAKTVLRENILKNDKKNNPVVKEKK